MNRIYCIELIVKSTSRNNADLFLIYRCRYKFTRSHNQTFSLHFTRRIVSSVFSSLSSRFTRQTQVPLARNATLRNRLKKLPPNLRNVRARLCIRALYVISDGRDLIRGDLDVSLKRGSLGWKQRKPACENRLIIPRNAALRIIVERRAFNGVAEIRRVSAETCGNLRTTSETVPWFSLFDLCLRRRVYGFYYNVTLYGRCGRNFGQPCALARPYVNYTCSQVCVFMYMHVCMRAHIICIYIKLYVHPARIHRVLGKVESPRRRGRPLPSKSALGARRGRDT